MLYQQRQFNDPLHDLVQEHLIGKKDLIGIEIGSYRGESADIFLRSKSFKTFFCIDPWEEGYDKNDEAASSEIIYAEKEFDERFENNKVIQKIKMSSNEAVNMFEDESIDFIYIDGNHQYEYVKNDIINYYSKIKKGGIIAGHDFNDNWLGVKKAVNEFFKKNPLKVYRDSSWIFFKN